MSIAETKTTGAENVEWDLSDLYANNASSNLATDLNTIVERSEQFKKIWRSRIAQLSSEEFLEMVLQFEGLLEQYDRMASYSSLLFSTDSLNTDYARQFQKVRETITAAAEHIIFVNIELAALSDERIAELMAYPALASRARWIEKVAEYRPYMLSEDMERVLAAKSITSGGSWVRLHDEVSNRAVYHFRGQELTFAEVAKLGYSSDRAVRAEAAESISVGLEKDVAMHAFIFNTVIADCASTNRLRGFPSWISSRNLSNEVTDTSVQSLVDAVVARYDLVRRYFALKQRILGYDTFCDYDRNVEVSGSDTLWSWNQAREIVLDAYSGFDVRAGNIASMFFDKNWIHAPVRKGKRSGAYSAGTIASAHPYVFMNYTGTARDVQVLAHELGHGIHQYLSRSQGQLLMDTPLTIAETASVFGEMITFKSLYEASTSEQERLGLLMSKIDGMISTVFRQIAFNRFEDAMHTTRAAEGELSVSRINELWLSTQKHQFGNSVQLSPGYEYWWSYISHFIHTPGYVYAYAYGELLVLALYEVYQSQPDSFPNTYIELLSSGGSKPPEALLKPFNLDITDPLFWNKGISVVEQFIVQAEGLFAGLSRQA